MLQNPQNMPLENFKKAIQTAEQKKEKSLFVFDVDSTLLCMKHRTQAIVRDCAKDPLFRENFPERLEAIRKVTATERDWSVKEVLLRHGFANEDPLTLAVEKIWKDRFFSNEYLHVDRPYKGCVEFMQYIARQNVHLYYLTARSHSRMHEGTVKSLKQWGFPLKSDRHLIMKEPGEEALSDAEYKVKHLKEMAKSHSTILFFENEPVILNLTSELLPSIQLFWMDSTHSQREKPPQTALTLNMSYPQQG